MRFKIVLFLGLVFISCASTSTPSKKDTPSELRSVSQIDPTKLTDKQIDGLLLLFDYYYPRLKNPVTKAEIRQMKEKLLWERQKREYEKLIEKFKDESKEEVLPPER